MFSYCSIEEYRDFRAMAIQFLEAVEQGRRVLDTGSKVHPELVTREGSVGIIYISHLGPFSDVS